MATARKQEVKLVPAQRNEESLNELKFGDGSDAARIGNSLAGPGPGLTPGESKPKANEAQAYADADKSEPFPTCFCGRPSDQRLMGQGIFCSEAHLRLAARWSKGFSHEAFDES